MDESELFDDGIVLTPAPYSIFECPACGARAERTPGSLIDLGWPRCCGALTPLLLFTTARGTRYNLTRRKPMHKIADAIDHVVKQIRSQKTHPAYKADLDDAVALLRVLTKLFREGSPDALRLMGLPERDWKSSRTIGHALAVVIEDRKTHAKTAVK